MAGRYIIIQHIQNPFVVSGCPVILVSHALTKDIENDCVFLQCKFKNLEAKEIQAFYINVQCFDVTGHSLDSVDDFSYLDLQVQQYQLFGDQIPVYLNDKETRIFSIIPSKIVFSDGTVWESNTSTPFKPFDKKPCSIESLGELSEQYKRDLHAICHQDQKHSYLPSVQQGFIVCGCGAIVLDGTEHCPDCGVDFEKLFPLNNSDKLQEELNQYKQEQAEREKQLRLAEEDRKHQNHLKKQQLIKKAKKLGIIVGSIFALIVACVLVIQVLIPSIRYSMAENAIASGKYEEAITTFEDLGDFKDSPKKIKETKYVWAESKLESGDTDGAIKLFTELKTYRNSQDRIQEIENSIWYQRAIEEFNKGNYEGAKTLFENLDTYLDSPNKVKECADILCKEHYTKAIDALHKYDNATALKEFLLAVPYKDSIVQTQKLGKFKQKLALGSQNIFWVESNNQIHVLNNYLDNTSTNSSEKHELDSVSAWKNITQVAASGGNVIGLQTNGNFVAAGIGWATMKGWTSNWSNIVSIDLGLSILGPPHIVGLKSDGTVLANGWSGRIPITGENSGKANFNDGGGAKCNVSSWSDIVAIAAGSMHTVGLKSDGTVVAAGDDNDSACAISGWNNIIEIDAGASHTIGLKSDGTVVSTRSSNGGSSIDIDKWTDIVSIASGNYHDIGLKSDGTVVASGSNDSGECNVTDWNQIICIWAGDEYTVGLKSDGTLITTGNIEITQKDLSNFKLF